ncbi:MAG: DUF692 family protein [Myxococcales bacterium]|nr:DUF692 family protein [Myxococcales bacterium]
MSFSERVSQLPYLGIGVSTEYGAVLQKNSLDIKILRQSHPEFATFLEVGIETSKGLDALASWWSSQGLPTTYHFLDVNLDDPADYCEDWLDLVRRYCGLLQPAWMCGDAGLWHFGPRDRNHMLLLPPVLTDDAAKEMAEGIIRLREETGLEVLPENPPGSVFVGDLHILEFFARLCELADTGILLDCAHLAIYQNAMGYEPLAGFDALDWSRVIEMHVAGSTQSHVGDYWFIEDDHSTNVLPDTWTVFENACLRTSQLRAVVFECERNLISKTLPHFQHILTTMEQIRTGLPSIDAMERAHVP